MAEAMVLEALRKTVNDWQVKRICLQEFEALLQWMEELIFLKSRSCERVFRGWCSFIWMPLCG